MATGSRTALARRETAPAGALVLSQLTRDQVELIKRTVCKGATDDELALFTHVCNKAGLDPFARQIHGIKRRVRNGDDWVEVLTIQVAIDGLRVAAARTGKYDGQSSPEWCGEDGVWTDVWLKSGPPHAARVQVFRKDSERPFVGLAYYRSYVQRDRDKRPVGFWVDDKAAAQLAKCAEALALRKAFPQDLSGVYAEEEMGQADNPEDPPASTVQSPRRASEARPTVVDIKPEPTAQAEPKEAKPAPAAAPQPQQQAGAKKGTWSGAMVDVTSKSGQKDGRPWTLYYLQGDGEKFQTFDAGIADVANSFKGTGESVDIDWEDTGRGKKALGISASDPGPEA